jgi:cytochrome c
MAGLMDRVRAAVVVGVLAAAIPCHAAPDVTAGKAYAQANCARCHSIDKSTPSSLPIAPPFRTLHERYPVQSLEEALGEGITTGHQGMPEFKLAPGQVGDFIAFLKSLGP